MGEYVAFSKAIVAERLTYETTGRVSGQGRDYLGFDTVEGCVDAVRKLFSDAGLRHEITR